ncbi:MAG: translation initiation factor IF-2 subunit beta [Pyrobaculum sp.]
MDEEYLSLLERAYRVITPKAQRRAEIPKIEVESQPRKTIVKNLGPIARRLNRDVYLVAKFFQKELAVPGTIDGDIFILHGEKSSKVVEAVYERFIKYYVVCPVCNSIDTELRREGRIFTIRCLACGASTPVRPL